ncbi:MAG: response regulator transcription factor [Sphingomonadales bacterium]|nr:MAG: response regulator transcription factor [Sphingomonadales bacterium]
MRWKSWTLADTIRIIGSSPCSARIARALLDRALSAAGFAMVFAHDGESALALLADMTPDLILLDAVMPPPDGFETCRRIKTDPRLRPIPVIFMTGLSDSDHVVEGLHAGGVDYVTKPIMLDELVARIHVHLANARMMRNAQAALDVTGRRLIATDASGATRWSTPLAAALLDGLAPEAAALIAAQIARMIALHEAAPDKASDRASAKLPIGDRQVEIAHLGRGLGQDYLFRLAELREGMEAAALQRALSLTPREGDVLFWIAQGKSNRDASEIMNISARTVNKHLEQIFIKLGVENRAAAAAIATRIIASAE